jgi:hypothetical protein
MKWDAALRRSGYKRLKLKTKCFLVNLEVPEGKTTVPLMIGADTESGIIDKLAQYFFDMGRKVTHETGGL